jgi:hypothetical protein
VVICRNPQRNVWNQRKWIHCQSRTKSDTSKARIHPIQIHTRPIHPQNSKYSILILVVDAFGVKYERKEDMDHLVKTLGDRYPIKVDLTAEFYLGITIKWDYEN